VVAEALALGVPVITTTGTPWKIWKPYECGWWIDLSKENLAKTLGMAMQKTTEDLETMGKTVLN
jgi:glycosyltransferase involved in cell wall biosynthesis